MSLVIRSTNKGDSGLILAFIKELAVYEKLAHEVVASEEILMKSLFEEKVAECLIAEKDGEPLGFAIFFHNFSTFLGIKGLYIEDIYVRPTARGQGVGGALFKKLAEVARERHCGRMEWSVLDWNESAIGFYKSMGAVGMDGWTTFRLDKNALENLKPL